MKDVKEEAGLLARDDAELDTFVADLFERGDKLNIPCDEAPSDDSRKLIPTIVEAFSVRTALVNFRPLSICYRNAFVNLYQIWPDAAERRIRPCPFCVTAVEQDDASSSVVHVTDHYHILNADSGQQMTVEVAQRCHRPKNDDERWIYFSGCDFVRIIVHDGVRCRPELPKRPQRALSLPLQADPLLEVFGFASRDELDALQLTCKFWRAIVDNAADTLALRPLEYVTIASQHVTIQRAPVSEARPGAFFYACWDQIRGYRPGEFRPEDVSLVVSLLRHGCALRYIAYNWESVDHFCPLSQHLADYGRAFRAKSFIMECYYGLKVTTPLQLAADIGAKDFEIAVRIETTALPLIFGNELLLSAERFHLKIGPSISRTPGPELSNFREHCHEYLRRAVGCHVSFRQWDSYAVFSCDHIIERFLAVSRSDDFAMPRSLQLHVVYARKPADPANLKPANCKYPTLHDVAIPRKALPRHSDVRYMFDVYHFHNLRTDEWLTVCLGKDPVGTVVYVFLQKGRIMTSVEDIAKMEPFSYQ